MKESRREGIASHPDPESCVASRKAGREALTGTCRRDIELRNKGIRSADVVHPDGRPYRWKRQRELPKGSAQSENPSMHGNSTRENRETPATPVTIS